MGWLDFIKRPFVGDQTTARLAYQRSLDYTLAGYTGNGGFHVLRSMNGFQPASIAPGNSLVLNDPSATGNLNTNIQLQPLYDDRSF